MSKNRLWWVLVLAMSLVATSCSVRSEDVAATGPAPIETAAPTAVPKIEVSDSTPSAVAAAAQAAPTPTPSETASVAATHLAPSDSESPTPLASEPVSFDPRLDYYVYFMNWPADPGNSPDFYRAHAGSGEQDRLTNALEDGLDPFPRFKVSPDQSMIAYIGDQTDRVSTVYVADMSGADARPVTETQNLRDIAWSSDSNEVFLLADNNEPGDLRWFVGAVDVESGSARVLLDSQEGKAEIAGTLDGFAYLVLTPPGPIAYRLVRIDEQSGVEVASLEAQRSVWAIDRKSGVAASIGGDVFNNSIVVVDLNQPDLEIAEFARTPDSKNSPVPSPDGSAVAYGIGASTGLVAAAADGSSSAVLVPANDASVLTSHTWAPDSLSVVYSVGDYYPAAPIQVAFLDGEVIDLGLTGRVLGVAPAP